MEGPPNIDFIWLTEDQIKQHGTSVDLVPSSRGLSFKTQGEYGAGAPTLNSSNNVPKIPKHST